MTKEYIKLIDAEGWSHATPNRSTDVNTIHLPESNHSDNSDMTKTTLATAADNLETSSIHARTAVSQPMTASTSSSSNPSIKDAGAGTASPYGTRSRNRAGMARPNYAEDREVEIDFEPQSTPKEDDSRKVARPGDLRSTSISESTTPPTNIIRRVSSAQLDYNNGGQVMSKDHIPGTSTFSANPAANVSTHSSKKRKTTSQSAPANATSQLSNSIQSGGNQTGTRGAGGTLTQVFSNYRESNMLSFDNCGGRLADGKLVADDGTVLGLNDHVYLVCEPPGEPYYLGRIMEFLHIGNDPENPIDALRINWYYRPKDIGRKVNDTRQVFASMHSDISPLTALRGLCQIKHKSEVQNLEELRRTQNCFWYEKLYDRYIHRYYEVIPTSQVVNVPTKVRKVLRDRWKFILVESGRGKELTSAVKSCKRCSGYCASNDSVDCAVCHQTYHMNCVRPPLLKKPSRGFAWACGPCSRAQERKLEARNTPNLADTNLEVEEEELLDEEEEDGFIIGDGGDTGRTSPAKSTDADIPVHPGTAEQIRQASLWPFRYLGVHCKVEDALDYDDRIYPRASSRLGPRHQANVTVWHGKPVELVKPPEIKKKYVKGNSHKKDAKLSKETIAALEADKMARDKRPKWVMDEPPGYIRRGEDYDKDDPESTAELLYKPPETQDCHSPDPEARSGSQAESTDRPSNPDRLIEDFMERIKTFAPQIGVEQFSVNFLDKALEIFCSNNYDTETSLKKLSTVTKKDLKEPELSAAEIKKFEDGIAKYGSELHSVKKHVKTVSSAHIVRFYYLWKKTERGKQVWGNYAGRKGKKEAKKAEASTGKLQDDVADDYDDSAFDNDKALEKKRGFQCKFCLTKTSKQWRRAPNTPAGTTVFVDSGNKSSNKDKGTQLMVALCLNCAVIWRKYAVQWEDSDDHGKKPAQNGGRGNKRKADDSLREFQLNEISWTTTNTDAATTPTGGTPMPQTSGLSSIQEQPRKKTKGTIEKDQADTSTQETASVVSTGPQKKKVMEKPAAPPPAPEIPKPKMLPCSICFQMDPIGDQHVTCRECRMSVHRNCYGVVGDRNIGKWVCDTCSNDRNPQVSIQYKCVLCPVEYTEQDFVEPPKISHKKKTEREREKDRVERENAQKAADYYRKRQEELNRPVNPREPLKRTANNMWVHVTCAVWTPEVKFGNSKALEPSEGITSIPSARHDEVCKACKAGGGACVACYSCRAPVHVECAHQNGYLLGFDIAPVKGSRRDQINIVNINGEAGAMTAAVWCKEHVPTKTIVHRMHDTVDETGLNALQLYVRNFKQADLTLTGTVRKANLAYQSTKVASQASTITASNRRTSTATTTVNCGRGSISNIKLEETGGSGSLDMLPSPTSTANARTCITCGVDVSPIWHPYPTLDATKASAATGRPNITSLPVSEKRGDSVEGDINFSESAPPLTNGHSSQNSESPKHHAALAAAALKEKSQESAVAPLHDQCHKCHHSGVQRPSLSPLEAATLPLDKPQSQIPAVTPSVPNPIPPLPSPQMPTTSHYSSWPAPSTTYTTSGSFGSWSRPPPTPPQSVTPVHQFNGNRSPRSTGSSAPRLAGSQVRQPPVALPRSPHLNGPHGQQLPNGYPTSPHRGISGPHQVQTSSFGSFASTRPPHHLTNGGPPLHAPESPFSQSSRNLHPSTFSSGTSPPVSREPNPTNRETVNQGHGGRSNEGRANGGASANPSLHNLLS